MLAPHPFWTKIIEKVDNPHTHFEKNDRKKSGRPRSILKEMIAKSGCPHQFLHHFYISASSQAKFHRDSTFYLSISRPSAEKRRPGRISNRYKCLSFGISDCTSWQVNASVWQTGLTQWQILVSTTLPADAIMPLQLCVAFLSWCLHPATP